MAGHHETDLFDKELLILRHNYEANLFIVGHLTPKGQLSGKNVIHLKLLRLNIFGAKNNLKIGKELLVDFRFT